MDLKADVRSDEEARRLDSSNPPSLGEAAPPLQESGVVGLNLAELPAAAAAASFRLAVGFDLGWRWPQLGEGKRICNNLVTAGGGGGVHASENGDCLRRKRRSTTTASSVIAAANQSSFIIIIINRERASELGRAEEDVVWVKVGAEQRGWRRETQREINDNE